MSIDSDLAASLAGWGSSALQIGPWQGRGLVDQVEEVDEDPAGNQVLVKRTLVSVVRRTFLDADGDLTISRGNILEVDGVAYVITDLRVGGTDGVNPDRGIDGRELRLVVRRA